MTGRAHADLHKIIGPRPLAHELNENVLREVVFYLAQRIDEITLRLDDALIRPLTPDLVAEAFDVPVELARLPLAGRRGASVVDPKQEPSLDPHRRHPVLKLQKRVTFTEADRADRRLAALEGEYDHHPDYASIPEKTGETRHYMLVTELEAYARALLLKQAITGLYPEADTEAIELTPVVWPKPGGAGA